jgi:hypothetical protein
MALTTSRRWSKDRYYFTARGRDIGHVQHLSLLFLTNATGSKIAAWRIFSRFSGAGWECLICFDKFYEQGRRLWTHPLLKRNAKKRAWNQHDCASSVYLIQLSVRSKDTKSFEVFGMLLSMRGTQCLLLSFLSVTTDQNVKECTFKNFSDIAGRRQTSNTHTQITSNVVFPSAVPLWYCM